MKHFYLQPSQIHRRLNVLSHLVVFLLVLMSSLFLVWKVIAVVLCFVSYLYAEKARIKTIHYVSMHFDKGVFLLVERSAKERQAQLDGNFLSSPWLIILNLRLQNEDGQLDPRKKTLILYKDVMSANEWRQLRVLLRTLPANSGESAKVSPEAQKQ